MKCKSESVRKKREIQYLPEIWTLILWPFIFYIRGSQPVVRVPLVVREQVSGGTHEHSKPKVINFK